MDLHPERRYPVYVCPRHYQQFAEAERGRWTPVPEHAPHAVDPAAASPVSAALVPAVIGAVPGHDGSWVI